jgi:hypothetical protein
VCCCIDRPEHSGLRADHPWRPRPRTAIGPARARSPRDGGRDRDDLPEWRHMGQPGPGRAPGGHRWRGRDGGLLPPTCCGWRLPAGRHSARRATLAAPATDRRSGAASEVDRDAGTTATPCCTRPSRTWATRPRVARRPMPRRASRSLARPVLRGWGAVLGAASPFPFPRPARRSGRAAIAISHHALSPLRKYRTILPEVWS